MRSILRLCRDGFPLDAGKPTTTFLFEQQLDESKQTPTRDSDLAIDLVSCNYALHLCPFMSNAQDHHRDEQRK